jgi:murein DD-endopeptidase MepM/ murein hydrolase activator NlpD
VLARAAELALRIEPAGVGFVRPVAGSGQLAVRVARHLRRRQPLPRRRRPRAADRHAGRRRSRGGRVRFAGWSGAYGYVVFLDHEAGWQTRYAHLSRIDVRVGDLLRQGRCSARRLHGASTGPAPALRGPHDGRALDPLGFVPR